MDDLRKARGSKFPPFPPKHRLLKIKHPMKIENIETGIKEGIRDCCAKLPNQRAVFIRMMKFVSICSA